MTDPTSPVDGPEADPTLPGGPRSRRRFLRDGIALGGALAAGGLVLDLTGCSSSAGTDGAAPGSSPSTTAAIPPTTATTTPSTPSTTTAPGTASPTTAAPVALGAHDVLVALEPARAEVPAERTVRAACAALDWSWLDRGDSVFVKLACNSANPHPSVTSPAAVAGLVAELYARGAGRVVVGDQAGVGTVRVLADGRRTGSTRDCLRRNGLLDAITAAGAEAHVFDEDDYHDGFFEATPPAGSHWTQPLALPEVVRSVDHVVYLPRIGAHAIAGYTAAHKLAVGWLRDDSRNHLHADAASFYEKYAEVSYVPELRDRLRLALVLGEQLLLHFGPDTNGTVLTADPRLVLASADLASLDAVMAGLLVHLNRVTPPGAGVRPYQATNADVVNRGFVTSMTRPTVPVPWGPATGADYTTLRPHAFEQGVSGDRALARAWAITGRPDTVRVVQRGAELAPEVAAAVAAHGEGLLTLV
ncbi:MAG: DUF362 domain-containing protein [Acidimicrobiales bacterium]